MGVSAIDAGSNMTSSSPLFNGIISGERRRGFAEVSARAARLAGGLQRLGVKQGDSVCMLMRNDIAFIEAAYAAMRLGAYGVPVNWHFKPEEINFVLKDSGSLVLIAHADMLYQLRDAIGAVGDLGVIAPALAADNAFEEGRGCHCRFPISCRASGATSW